MQYKHGVPCRTPSRSDRFNGVTGDAGGPKGRNRNLPWPPCKKGYKETPFSFVYLNPSVTAYAVPAPRIGESFGATTYQKLSPFMGKVARSAERGAAKNSRMPRVIPPQLRLRSAAPPFHGGAFWCSTNSAYSAVPLRGAIVSMGLRGSPGGLRGEIEIFPGPLEKSYKDAYLLFALLPQKIRFTANFQLPLRGSLLVRYLNSYVKPPSLREVDFAKQKTEGVHRGCSCLSQPLSLTSFDSSPLGEPFGVTQNLTLPPVAAVPSVLCQGSAAQTRAFLL